MSVVPDSPIGPGDRFPYLSVVLMAGMVALATASALGWPDTAWLWPSVHFLVLTLVASAALEFALGVGVFLISMALCGLAAAGVPLLLSGGQVDAVTWLPLAANAMLGLNVGLLLDERTRPFFFIPGPLAGLVLNWLALLLVWILVEAAWLFLGDGSPVMLRGLCFAAGLLIGVVMAALSLMRPSMVSPTFIEHRVTAGMGQARELVDQHKLKQARRLLARLQGMAPDNPDLKKLRYSAWKFDPGHPEFHSAAAALLDSRETDESTNAFIDRMYADYVAVSQGQPKLPVDQHLRLAARFAANGKIDEAANIVNVHLQRGSRDDHIPSTLLAVSEAYLSAKRPNRSAYFADTLVGLFPKSREAVAGRRILHQIADESR